jgi:DNA-binding transcriptional regulator YiaG
MILRKHKAFSRRKAMAKTWTGDEIRALRHTLRWSQRTLAVYLDTYQPHVSMWERGKTAPREITNALLTLLARKVKGIKLETDPIRERRVASVAKARADRDLEDEIFEAYQRTLVR